MITYSNATCQSEIHAFSHSHLVVVLFLYKFGNFENCATHKHPNDFHDSWGKRGTKLGAKMGLDIVKIGKTTKENFLSSRDENFFIPVR